MALEKFFSEVARLLLVLRDVVGLGHKPRHRRHRWQSTGAGWVLIAGWGLFALWLLVGWLR